MSTERLSQLEEPVRVVLAFNDALNRHDVAGMMRLMTEDCVFENTNPPPEGSVYSGKAAVTQFWQDFFQQSPHAHIEIEEIFGVGARCVMRWRYEWVDRSGRQGHVRGVDLYQVRDNLICEKLSYVKG